MHLFGMTRHESSIVDAYQGIPVAQRGGWKRRWKVKSHVPMSRSNIKADRP